MFKSLTIVALAAVIVSASEPIATQNSRNFGFSDGRIIGGEAISIEEVPFQVSIAVNGRHYCGGSIIGKDWIVTASHCATLPNTYYNIRAGSVHSYVGGSYHKVSLVVKHENFTELSYGIPSNDIALFKVEPPFIFDETRRPIELFEEGEETEEGVNAVITGWGSITPNFIILPTRLQVVQVPIISKEKCREAYWPMTDLRPGQICTHYPRGGKDACQGDSGGPLVVGDRLAGIVSWGRGCATKNYPGVYTEVAYYREWIDRTMEL